MSLFIICINVIVVMHIQFLLLPSFRNPLYIHNPLYMHNTWPSISCAAQFRPLRCQVLPGHAARSSCAVDLVTSESKISDDSTSPTDYVDSQSILSLPLYFFICYLICERIRTEIIVKTVLHQMYGAEVMNMLMSS